VVMVEVVVTSELGWQTKWFVLWLFSGLRTMNYESHDY